MTRNSCEEAFKDVQDLFRGWKTPAETIDFVIDYNQVFDDFDPVDQISSSSWAVMRGTVSIDSDRVEGTNFAIARVSGGTHYNSIHEIRNTVVGVSGQTYVRTIMIKILKR